MLLLAVQVLCHLRAAVTTVDRPSNPYFLQQLVEIPTFQPMLGNS